MVGPVDAGRSGAVQQQQASRENREAKNDSRANESEKQDNKETEKASSRRETLATA